MHDANYCSPSAFVEGDVEFGRGCVVLSHARIIARGGPIVFGDFCLVEEYAEIHHNPSSSSHPSSSGVEVVQQPRKMMIGSHNHFKSRSIVSGVGNIGMGNIISSFAHLKGSDGDGEHPLQLGDYNVVAEYVEMNDASRLRSVCPDPSSMLMSRRAVLPTVGLRTSCAVAVMPVHGTRCLAELATLRDDEDGEEVAATSSAATSRTHKMMHDGHALDKFVARMEDFEGDYEVGHMAEMKRRCMEYLHALMDLPVLDEEEEVEVSDAVPS